MKKTFAYIAMTCLCAISAGAQSRIGNDTVIVNRKSIEVRFTVDSKDNGIPARRKEVLIPYVYNDKDTLYLQTVEVYGKGRFKKERQEQALAGNGKWELQDNSIIKGGIYEYNVSFRNRKWMDPLSLGIRRYVVGCNCEDLASDEQMQGNVETYVKPVPVIVPVPENPQRFTVVDNARKWDFGKEELEIIFRVSKTDLQPEIYGNRKTLDRICAAIQDIRDSTKTVIDKIEIAGFASPEGGSRFNDYLSRNRAEALKTFIIKEMPELADSNFVMTNGQENWVGLRRAVEESDMAYREEILDIIDNVTDNNKRKTELKSLAGGRPYRHLLRNIYPRLRNACYIAVYYDVLGDVASDAINKANVHIRNGEYEEALEILLPHSEDERAFNPIGICHMMLRNEEEAVIWFEKAIESGDTEAEKNLSQINM